MKTFEQLIAAKKPVLVDFYADWCGPCKMMPPILREVKDELGDQVTIILSGQRYPHTYRI